MNTRLLIGAALTLLSCASPRTQSDTAALLVANDTLPAIELSRGACLGGCPIYQVSLYSDGRVMYTGTQFVHRLGVHFGRVPATAVSALYTQFVDSGFAKIPADITLGSKACGADATDMPTMMLATRSATTSHRVRVYLGCLDHPRVLGKLAVLVDSVANTMQWTVRDSARRSDSTSGAAQ